MHESGGGWAGLGWATERDASNRTWLQTRAPATTGSASGGAAAMPRGDWSARRRGNLHVASRSQGANSDATEIVRSQQEGSKKADTWQWGFDGVASTQSASCGEGETEAETGTETETETTIETEIRAFRDGDGDPRRLGRRRRPFEPTPPAALPPSDQPFRSSPLPAAGCI